MPKTGNRCLAVLALLLLCACDDGKRHDTRGGVVDGWPVWGHTQSGQRYSANTQITPENVKDLKVAWTYRTGDLDPPGGNRGSSRSPASRNAPFESGRPAATRASIQASIRSSISSTAMALSSAAIAFLLSLRAARFLGLTAPR